MGALDRLTCILIRRMKRLLPRSGLAGILRSIVACLVVLLLPASLPAESYVVQKNDNLTSIARDHGVSIDALARANKMSVKETIYAGQELTIPPDEVVVQKSDTLTSIAREHGVTAAELAAANDLSLKDVIHPGEKLILPSSGAPPSESQEAAAKPPPKPKEVTVRKNESLSVIARRHGVTVGDLARVNGLSIKDTIYVGQKLRIPSGDVKPVDTGPKLSWSVQKAIDDARVSRGRWKYIVIHHSATPAATVKGMDEYHRRQRHMENGLAYHFVIGNGRGMGNGEVAVGDRWKRQIQGGHLKSEADNNISIGICLVGNFDKTRPTASQLDSLEALLEALMRRCHLTKSSIRTHSQMHPRHTRCPGKNLNLKAILQRVNP